MDTMITMEQFEKMTEAEQLGELVKANEKAKTDDTPYIAVENDELHVIGDPNKTEVKKHNYVIDFAFPNTAEIKQMLKDNGEKILLETEDFIKVRREFKDMYLLPRRATHVMEAFAQVQTFITSVSRENEDGELEFTPKTEKEMLTMLKTLNREVEDSIYRAVGAFLRLSDFETDCMILTDVMYNAVKIASDNPDLMNGSNLFFE